VARALINNPEVLLADEPTGALDSDNARNLASLLTGINRDFGLTIVLVTHSTELAGKMDRSLSLNNGRLES
jgi:ABC-type lipoprotein export system ATPase subunit